MHLSLVLALGLVGATPTPSPSPTAGVMSQLDDLARRARAASDASDGTLALQLYKQAYSLAMSSGDVKAGAGYLGDVGMIEGGNGDYAAALRDLERSYEMFQRLGDKAGMAAQLDDLGNNEGAIGLYSDALRDHERALALFKSLPDPKAAARAAAWELGSVAVAEQMLNRPKDALRDYEAALASARANNDLPSEAANLRNEATVLVGMGRYQEAIEDTEAALAIDKQLKVVSAVGQEQLNIILTKLRMGDRADALAEVRSLLAQIQGEGDVVFEAGLLGSVGIMEYDSGDYKDALRDVTGAVQNDRKLGVPGWGHLQFKAQTEAAMGLRSDAIQDYSTAIDVIERERAGLTTSDQSSFFSSTLSTYDNYIAYLLELGGRFPETGYARMALEVLERKNARAVLEETGRSIASHFKEIPDIQELDHLDHQLDAQQATVVHLRSIGQPNANAENKLTQLSVQRQALESQIRQRYPNYYRLIHPEPLSFGDLQKVLVPGETVLAYELLPDASVLFVLDRQHFRYVLLAGQDEIEARLKTLSDHIAGIQRVADTQQGAQQLNAAATNDLPKFNIDSYALYQKLVPDVARKLIDQSKSILIVPSGALYGLAWETLVTEPPVGAHAHYLVEDKPISYIPSASLLGLIRDRAVRPGMRKPLLAFARPTPSLAGQSLMAFVRAYSYTTRGGAVFGPLQHSYDEANKVRIALGAPAGLPPAGSMVTDDRATRAYLEQLNASNQLQEYQYILFATHAVLPDKIDNLTEPAIVLAHPELSSAYLTMSDIFGLRLNADFVALSACDTGAGPRLSGDDISGLTRAFLFAGTPAISVTLWEVEDAAAERLDPTFFAAMKRGDSSAEALQQAKLALLRSDQPIIFRHPFAWGPAVVFGDGDRQTPK
jgi:CHAT domain-containing protein